MKSVKTIITILFLSACFLLFDTGLVIASESEVIDCVEIDIDIPVNGVELKKSAAVYEHFTASNAMSKEPNTGTSVDMVVWYKTSAPGEPLDSGYEAVLGESYYVNILVTAKSGYSFSKDFHLSQNTINAQAAEAYSFSGADGTEGWLFSVQFDTIAAVPGKPVVTIQDMQVSPYEGNPMEVIVNATGTNLKYQWQIVSEYAGEVNLDDNIRYEGTKTSHFKLHTYFGDVIDEDWDFMKARCKVTNDNGTAYSQEVWFVLRDRNVVDEVLFSDLDEPIYGARADYRVTSLAPAKYDCSKIVWYGPKLSDGSYEKMSQNATFSEGEYYCRIYISTTEAYKFDSDTNICVDDVQLPFTTIRGKDRYPYTVDTYYVDVPFTVAAPEPEDTVIRNVEISGIKTPVAGDNMLSAEYITAKVDPNVPYSVSSVAWFTGAGNNSNNKIFEAGKKYMVRVILEPDEGYLFDMEGTTNVTLNGYTTSLDYQWSDGKTSVVYIFSVEVAGEDPDDGTLPDDKDPDDGMPQIPNLFIDVQKSDYYYDAVLWAVQNGITTGVSETQFGPNEICTRAQAVTFLWRNAGEPEPAGAANPFTDVKAGTYYYKAVLWAVEKGITTGTSATTFSPNDYCSRSQIVTFLWRAHGKEIVNAANPFVDVKSQAYYYHAVLWAVKNNITTGTEKDKFSPDMDCTRAQIVTFLYRSVK